MSLKEFQILNKLGSGSFGIVYKSRRKQTNETVVLKQVDLKRMDKRMREWAMNEAKIMKNVESLHIVKYYQSFTEKEKLYIVMEYCSGGDLSQFLKGQMGKPLTEDTVWKLTLQIMLGLRDLHSKKILHRDIKTMNVFLTDNKAVRIGDLGVARTMTGDFASTVVGTPYYLSPEMCEEKPYNQKTDVWAMGCLVYELCTGKHPFEANTQAALALKIVVGKYAPIPSQYSQTLVWLVRLCLSVDYKRRPSIEYLLSQQSVMDLGAKYGIYLEKRKDIINEKPQQTVKEAKVQVKQQMKVVQKPIVPIQKIERIEKVDKQPQIKKNEAIKKPSSVQKIKEKSLEKGKDKVYQKQAKKQQYKPIIPNQANKFYPPKEKSPQQEVPKKVQVKQKHIVKAPTIKQVSEPTAELVKQIPKPKKIVQEPQQQKCPSSLLLQSKPRKSAQQLVDDDELFKDFGITPEKLNIMGQKMDFKKINTINWSIAQQKQEKSQPTPKTAGQSQFLQLPTIKTPSACEIVPVDCKQADQEQVAEQMDDNVPYRSQSQGSQGDNEVDDTLLLEEMPEIQEEGQLKRKQGLVLLEKKVFENQRRKKELLGLKEQYQKQILQRINKGQYERIKEMIREDKDVDGVIAKELNGGNVLKLIKIYHYEIEIARCELNIAKWQEKSKELGGQ